MIRPSAVITDYDDIKNCSKAMGNCYGKNCTVDSLILAVKHGHLSLLEHASVSFDIVCSQKVLAQITRHRHFSFTVQSTRGCDITGNGFFKDWAKPTYTTNDEWYEFLRRYDDMCMKAISLVRDYNLPNEISAYALPLGTNVKLQVTGNLRAWFEYLQKRLCSRASEEHRILATEIYTSLNGFYPSIFNKEVLGLCSGCKEHSCSFTGKKKDPFVSKLEG